MNKKGYSQILDVVAGDQVPKDLDLAPNILARIQKQKGFRMQPRTMLFSAAMLVAIVLIVLFYTVPGMAAAIGRWFGYLPGVGLVSEGQIRMLESPVSMTHEGITVTVEQAVLDPEHTVLVYSVEGIPGVSISTRPEDDHCPYEVSLLMPDGSSLLASPNGIQSWASGYQHRLTYPPVPAAVNDAKLAISCLFNTRPGAAPEDWVMQLRFVPIPPDVTAFPVIEISTLTTLSAAATPTQIASGVLPEKPTAITEASPEPAAMTLTLDRAVQMDDGYLIYATVHWKDTPFASLDVMNPAETLHLLNANGQEMLYELLYDEQTGVNIDQRQTVFAIKTAPVQITGPLTLTLDWVAVDRPVNASFVFDPGPDPKPGQTWALNQDVKIGKYNLRIRTATAEVNGYSFELSSENGILNASLADMQGPIVSGGGGGGGGNPGDTFFSGFNYAESLPEGPITVTVGSIAVRQIQRLKAQWTPPAASPNLLPTQPAACLTANSWKTAVAKKPALDHEVTGRVLTSGQLDKDDSGMWGVTITNLDGWSQQVVEGARDGSPSPDGTKLAYSSPGAGISILDLASGQTKPVPGTADGDFNPIWSPDGKEIVFNRGMGIFDLFMISPDGSGLHSLTHGGVQEWPVGWLPDGRLLYVVPGRENEYTVYELDVESGRVKGESDSQVYSHDNLQSFSPDGKYIINTEKTFGERWLTYINQLDGSNRWLLANSSLWVMTPIWSPDGQWLLVGVSDTDPGTTIGALINLSTCQVIALPDLHGSFLGWIP